MALYPLHPGVQPYGELDIVNTELSSIKGGEVMTLTTATRTNSSTETAAADVLDGYTYATTGLRPAATRASSTGNFPLFLSDDGSSPDYLTYFGRIVGANVGTTVANGTVLGPHTGTGSGKVTLWQNPGMYAISTDALASDFVSSITVAGLSVGASIGFGSSTDIGRLAHNLCSNRVATSGVCHLVEFGRSESLVTTPASFFSASVAYDRIKVIWHAGLGVRTL